MAEDEQNVVIYKGSDLLYDPWNYTCGSGASTRIKLIQVCLGESIQKFTQYLFFLATPLAII